MMVEELNPEPVQDTPKAEQVPGTPEAAPQKDMSERLYPEQGKEGESAPDAEKPAEEKPVESEENPKEEEAEKAAESKDEGAPEKYELKLPEDSQIKQTRLDEIAAEAREQGLSNEQAQLLADREHKVISDYIESEQSAIDERSQKWVEDVKSDSELGGEKFITSVEQAKRVVSRFASEDLKEMLVQTGLGNHPEVIRLFSRVGKEMASDEFVQGEAQVKRQPKTIAERLYGNTTPN